MRTVALSLSVTSLIAASVIAGMPTTNSAPVRADDITVVGEAILATPGVAVSSAITSSDCTTTVFALERWRLTGTYSWYYNPAGAPAAVSSTALTTIYRATANLVTGQNRCGIKVALPIAHSYKGSTRYAAQVSAAATCTGNDGVSVTSWGVLPASTLAYTCVYYKTSTGAVVSSDLMINSARKWFTGTIPAGCTDSFDLESVVVHERGHTAGLSHVDQATHPRQTMSPRTFACATYKRLLGSGDLKGLRTLSGV